MNGSNFTMNYCLQVEWWKVKDLVKLRKMPLIIPNFDMQIWKHCLTVGENWVSKKTKTKDLKKKSETFNKYDIL